MLRKAKNIKKKFGINKSSSSSEDTSEDENETQTSFQSIQVNTAEKPKVTHHPNDTEPTKEKYSNTQLLLKPHCPGSNDRPTLMHYTTTPSLAAKHKPFEKKSILQEQPEPRSAQVKFSLPETPQRTRLSSSAAYPKARPARYSLIDDQLSINQQRHPISNKSSRKKKSGWRLFGDSDDDQNYIDRELPIEVGSKVRLKMRPLPTFGYVKYIGPVDFDKGEFIGIELDFGVGNCDGSIDGIRYFESEGRRGIFLKRREIEAISDDSS